jgi:hypothetical protein
MINKPNATVPEKYCFTPETNNCTTSISPTENSAKPNPRVRY